MARVDAAARTTALTSDDWTSRALELLMDEGVAEVKISRLCKDLGVTKGSFYWRFDDLESLKEAVAERWCAETREMLGAMRDLTDLPPLDRLRTMTTGLIDDRTWSVQRALRDWARTDARVAAAITESDQFVFGLVQQTLQELGSDAAGARMRAGLLVYAGIGFAHGQAGLPKPTVDDVEDLIAFLAEDADRRTR